MQARKVVVLAAVPALALLSACGSSSAGSSSPGKISVTADDKSCKSSATTAVAGPSSFSVRNAGSKVTELYVYAPGDRVVGEVEQIGPGISRDLTVELQAGTYQLACKPGMTGDGIRTPFTVTGGAGPAAGTAG
ncbi:MAG TPA: cupredoxin domain-containing protein [Frankiaceae bacterium]|nr:cupredoxin domain-containing protein [Frankiaceae bacterium]